MFHGNSRRWRRARQARGGDGDARCRAQGRVAVNGDGRRRSAFELLSYPDVDSATVLRLWPNLGEIEARVLDQLAIDAQYAVYLERQRADVEAVRRDEGREIRRGSTTR